MASSRTKLDPLDPWSKTKSPKPLPTHPQQHKKVESCGERDWSKINEDVCDRRQETNEAEVWYAWKYALPASPRTRYVLSHSIFDNDPLDLWYNTKSPKPVPTHPQQHKKFESCGERDWSKVNGDVCDRRQETNEAEVWYAWKHALLASPRSRYVLWHSIFDNLETTNLSQVTNIIDW